MFFYVNNKANILYIIRPPPYLLQNWNHIVTRKSVNLNHEVTINPYLTVMIRGQLRHGTRQLCHFYLLVHKVSLQAREQNLTLSRFQAIYE